MNLIRKYKDHTYYNVSGKEIMDALGFKPDKNLFVALSIDMISGEGTLLVSNEGVATGKKPLSDPIDMDGHWNCGVCGCSHKTKFGAEDCAHGVR